jgi:carboxypeptidase C (cathepsin A)
MTASRLCLFISVMFASPFCAADPARVLATNSTLELPRNAAHTEANVLSVTEHQITIEHKTLNYRTTAGFLPLKTAVEGSTIANIFFVAYTLNGDDRRSQRPVTFVFNGGPGSASLWLQLGALGPKRVIIQASGAALAPPYQIEENPATWLDETDLVFVDPVSTGYSRAAPGQDPKQFYGYREDIESLGEFIRLYTTRFERWSSPKLLVGESYGAARVAGLAAFLHDRFGLYCNGIALLSPAIDYSKLNRDIGGELGYAWLLPTYTATAWYHKKLHGEWAATLPSALKQAEEFALHEYALALLQGDALTTEKMQRVADRMSELTGIPAAYLMNRRLHLDPIEFGEHLLSDDPNRFLAGFDTRVVGVRPDAGAPADFDPGYHAVFGAYTAAFNDYARNTLRFESDLPYVVLANIEHWKLADDQFLNATGTLRREMHRNPNLRVWMTSGYFDMVIPYFAVDQVIREMNLDPEMRAHIFRTVYAGGHMTYTAPAELLTLKQDFRQWLKTIPMLPAREAPAH